MELSSVEVELFVVEVASAVEVVSAVVVAFVVALVSVWVVARHHHLSSC